MTPMVIDPKTGKLKIGGPTTRYKDVDGKQIPINQADFDSEENKFKNEREIEVGQDIDGYDFMGTFDRGDGQY